MKCEKCNKELKKEDIKAVVENYLDKNNNPFDITSLVINIKNDVLEIGVSALCFQIEDEQAKVFCEHCDSLIGSFEMEQKH